MQRRYNPSKLEVYKERAKIKQGKYAKILIKTLSSIGLIYYRYEMDLRVRLSLKVGVGVREHCFYLIVV